MQRTQQVLYPFYAGASRFALPGTPRVSMEDVKKMKFDTASRQQWDYNAINDRVTSASEFGNMSDRPHFDGLRPDNSPCFDGTNRSNYPHFKKLHEHFDKYTQPGSNPKVEAARAVVEHWDMEHFQYPGEAWQRNRPSFRSVPAELLNRQTWYHWVDFYKKYHEILPTSRSRIYNPIWPPPGYKKPKYQTKKEFVFGVEEPGLVSEIERWGWARAWHEHNNRIGPWEIIAYFFFFCIMWHVQKEINAQMKWKTMHANQYYPGKSWIRSFGEPADWDNEPWWWQRPLEEFPNVGEVWYFNAIKYKYMNHLKKVEESQRVAAELAAEE